MSSRQSVRVALVALALGVVAALAGCDQSKNPLVGAPLTQLNLYAPSLGLAYAPTAYRGYGGVEYVYVDSYDTARVNYPYFLEPNTGGYSTGSADLLSYPEDSQYNPGAGLEHVTYMNLPAGTHQLWFTDNTMTAVLDTTLTFAAGRKTILYVNDSMNTNYRLLALDETAAGPYTGGARFRIINFSPTSGPLNAYVLTAAGQQLYPASLPEGVAFDSVTPYVALDSATYALADGNIYINLFAGTDTATVLATAKVPSQSGRSFHIVFFGYTGSGQQVAYPAHGSSPATQVFFNFDAQAWVRETY